MVFNYYKDIHAFNIPFSILSGILGIVVMEGDPSKFFLYFFLALLTGGFVLSLYYYQLRYASQYYFYHNRGFSKRKLILISSGINLSLFLIYTCLSTL